MDLYLLQIQDRLSDYGLVVIGKDDESVLFIGKPSSLKGRAFEDFDEPVSSGAYNLALLTDAPILKIKQLGQGRKTKYFVDMSVAYAPAPKDKVWFRCTYKDKEQMIADIVNLFLGNETEQDKIFAKDIAWHDNEQNYISFTKKL